MGPRGQWGGAARNRVSPAMKHFNGFRGESVRAFVAKTARLLQSAPLPTCADAVLAALSILTKHLEGFVRIYSRVQTPRCSFPEEDSSRMRTEFTRTISLEEPAMKTTAIALSRLRLGSPPNLAARLPDFVTLMKPRVMVLAVFTAFVGLMIAPARLDPLL